MRTYYGSSELYHYGIKRKSGRYKYGSGDRPFQREKRGLFFRRKKSEAGPESQKIKLSPEEFQEMKNRAVKSGNPTEVLKLKEDMTTSELIDAANRIDAIRRISNASVNDLKAKKDAGFNAIDGGMKKVAKVNTWVETGLKSAKLSKEFMDILNKALEQSDKQKK